jgi:predicted RND superfamily exporter protein
MTGHILIIIGAAITIIWGVAHLFPTKSVVKGFGDISTDNKNIIAMEWIVEGVSLIFIGVVVLGVSFIDAASNTAVFVFLASAGILIVLALVSLFTGFKVNFLPFKLCPVLFTTSAILILSGYALLK